MGLSHIGQYVTSLLPSFERGQIEEDLRVLKQDLVENTLPPLQAGADYFRSMDIKSSEVKKFDQTFKNNVTLKQPSSGKAVPQGFYINVTNACLINGKTLVENIETNLDKLFGRDVVSSGISYGRANILRLVEAINFANRYARKLLLWTFYNENSAHGTATGSPFTKAENDWLVANRTGFFAVITLLSNDPKIVMNAINVIPNMAVVPEEVDVATSAVGEAKLDPLRLGFIPLTLNPIYHIRIHVAEWQAARYSAGVEERRALEYRLLALRDSAEGKKDAKLEQEIGYTEERLKKLNARLAKMEEE